MDLWRDDYTRIGEFEYVIGGRVVVVVMFDVRSH